VVLRESIPDHSFFGWPKVQDHLKDLAMAITLGNSVDDMILPLGVLMEGWTRVRGFSNQALVPSQPVTLPSSVPHSWPAQVSVHRPKPIHLPLPTPDYYSAASSPAPRSEASYESVLPGVSALTKQVNSMLIV
jgi:hypothetical protein